MEDFACVRCGNCCRWPGAVKLAPDEVDAIAGYLAVPVEECLERHTEITPDRRHLSLREKSNGECEYLVTGPDGLAGCAIEPVKPEQCRAFPLKWNFPGWENECAGGRKRTASAERSGNVPSRAGQNLKQTGAVCKDSAV